MSDIENIWHEYHKKLLLFIKQRTNNDIADDILQEVFIKIYTQINSLKDEKKLESWLFQITRNTIIDYYRSKVITKDLPDWLEEKSTKIEAEIHKELASCLEPMIKILPDKYKKAIQLSEIEGKTQKDVAKIESISLSGAKSRIQRGRKLLKDVLSQCCQIELNHNNQLISYENKDNKCKYC